MLRLAGLFSDFLSVLAIFLAGLGRAGSRRFIEVGSVANEPFGPVRTQAASDESAQRIAPTSTAFAIECRITVLTLHHIPT